VVLETNHAEIGMDHRILHIWLDEPKNGLLLARGCTFIYKKNITILFYENL
jgi:hypothetical protein